MRVPRSPRRPQHLAAALGALTLAALCGCAGAPPAPATAARSEPPAAEPRDPAVVLASPNQSPNAAFEKQQLERATQALRQGRLAEAALAYEVLTVLRPDMRDYRERLADTRRQIDAAVAERLPRATQAHKRGELDLAAQQYLGVLALAPDNEVAADGLRAVERDRNKRNYLGKYSRLTLTRRAMADAEVQGAGNGSAASNSTGMPGMPGALSERNDLEHASMLSSQGEVDEAIAMLEKRVAQDRRDDAARLMLADVYYQKAEKIAAKDRPGAIAALERSVKLDPGNARASARLRQLKAPAPPAAASAPAGAQAPLTRGAAPAPKAVTAPPPKAAVPAAAASSAASR